MDNLFNNFLVPLFDEVLINDFNSIPNETFENLVIETSMKFLLIHVDSKDKSKAGTMLDKLVEEYLSAKT